MRSEFNLIFNWYWTLALVLEESLQAITEILAQYEEAYYEDRVTGNYPQIHDHMPFICLRISEEEGDLNDETGDKAQD